MRIAYILPNLHKTGGTRVALELGKEMVSRGNEYYIIIPSGRIKTNIPDGLHVIECGIKVNSPLWAVPVALLSMEKQIPDVDVLLASMPPYALFAQRVGKDRHIPVVNMMLGDDVRMFDDHSYIKNDLILRIYRAIARRSLKAEYVFANSHWTAVQLLHHSGRRPRAIIPSGYNDKVFQDTDFTPGEDGVCKLVTIGRRARAKGFQDIIRALNILREADRDFSLKVITNDDLDMSEAQFKYELLHPENDIELANYYKQGDIYLHASWSEGFGLPPLEAMACGLAVVATDSGGIKEYLCDGENCILAPPKEPKLLAKAIKSMMDGKEQRTRFRKRAKEIVMEYSWQRIGDKFEGALSDVIEDFNHNG